MGSIKGATKLTRLYLQSQTVLCGLL